MAEGATGLIRVDEIWLSREPMDMRAGADTALARVVRQFGKAKPHCAYVFTNRRANRLKILMCDGFGIWLASRKLYRGRFLSGDGSGTLVLDEQQLQALVVGLPWQYAGAKHVIDTV